MCTKTILLLLTLLSVALSGCTSTNYSESTAQIYTPTPISTADPSVAIFKELKELNDDCKIEIQTSNDLRLLLLSESPDGRLHDEGDVFFLVEQRQRQDLVCQVCINYIKTHRELIDTKLTPKYWGSDIITTYEINKRTNEDWYERAADAFGFTIPRQTLPTWTPETTTSSATPVADTQTSTTYIPVGQTELAKLHNEKLDHWHNSVIKMSEATTTGIRGTSCSAELQQSISYCKHDSQNFRLWLNTNKVELERAGMPIGPQITAIEATLTTCKEMEALCAELPTIVWGS